MYMYNYFKCIILSIINQANLRYFSQKVCRQCLHKFVVIELKTGESRSEYAGKLNFYLSAVDSQLKTENDNPSIGLLMQKRK